MSPDPIEEDQAAASTAPHKRLDPFRVALRERDFRLLLVSIAVSMAGDWFYTVALAVFVYDRTGSPAWVAAATIGRMAPYVIFAPLAGDLADRVDRRKLLVATDLSRAALMGALAAAAALDLATGWALALAFLCTAAGTPYSPAVTALTPTVVPEHSLAAANALTGAANYFALVLGPVLGTIAIVLGPPEIAFGVNAASFGLSAFAIAAMRPRRLRRARPTASPVGWRRALEGISPIMQSGETVMLAGFFIGQAFIYGLESVLLVLAAEELLRLGADGYGWLLAAIGLGGLIAAVFSGRLSAVRTPTLLLGAGALAVGIPLASLAAIRSPWIAAVLLTFDGAGTLLTETLAVTALQRTLPEDRIGRVFAAMDALAFGGVLLGSFLAPILVEVAGLKVALIVAGVTGPAAAIAALPWIRNVDRYSRAKHSALRSTVDVLARSRIFQGASRDTLEMLAASVLGSRVPAGQTIVREGDPADEFYVIIQGEVVVEHEDDPSVKTRLTSGDHFGEIGILEGIPRTASVRAVTDCTLFRIDAGDFLGVINKAPSMRGSLVRVATMRRSADRG